MFPSQSRDHPEEGVGARANAGGRDGERVVADRDRPPVHGAVDRASAEADN